jgi:hypothetical protein
MDEIRRSLAQSLPFRLACHRHWIAPFFFSYYCLSVCVSYKHRVYTALATIILLSLYYIHQNGNPPLAFGRSKASDSSGLHFLYPPYNRNAFILIWV